MMKKKSNRSNILISGWYGANNLGDEIILSSIVQQLAKEERINKISTFSINPSYTRKEHGINAVYHVPSIKKLFYLMIKGKFTELIKMIRTIHESDIILMGGGGFLSDWNPDAIKPWLTQIFLFKGILRKKVILYGIGAGPFSRDKYIQKVRKLLNTIDGITVRDNKSYLELSKCKVSTPITVTADPVINYQTSFSFKQQSKKKKIGIAIAPLFTSKLWNDPNNKYIAYIEAYKKFFNELNIKYGNEIELHFILMQDDYDRVFNETIISFLENKENVSITPTNMSNNDKIQYISTMDINIGMRLHSIIISSIFNVPSFGVIYHHKVDEFIERAGLKEVSVGVGDGGNWINQDLDPKEMLNKFDLLYNNLDKYKRILHENIEEMKSQEKNNIKIIKELLYN